LGGLPEAGRVVARRQAGQMWLEGSRHATPGLHGRRWTRHGGHVARGAMAAVDTRRSRPRAGAGWSAM